MADDLLRAFRFRVSLLRSPDAEAGSAPADPPDPSGSGAALGDGGFQECSGLEVEMEVADYQEGGRNDAVIRRVGRARHQPIVLKRGMLAPGGAVDTSLWDWIQDVVGGVRPVARYDGIVEVLDPTGGSTLATWAFTRGLPQKVSLPHLDARTGEIAIEELSIVHEGLRLVG